MNKKTKIIIFVMGFVILGLEFFIGSISTKSTIKNGELSTPIIATKPSITV